MHAAFGRAGRGLQLPELLMAMQPDAGRAGELETRPIVRMVVGVWRCRTEHGFQRAARLSLLCSLACGIVACGNRGGSALERDAASDLDGPGDSSQDPAPDLHNFSDAEASADTLDSIDVGVIEGGGGRDGGDGDRGNDANDDGNDKGNDGQDVRDGGADGSPGVDGSVPTCGRCVAYGTPSQVGRITASNLANISGMATSQRNPGIIYLHNDMTRTEFFAVEEDGTLRETFTFGAQSVVDMEDMAVGPCPSGTCVFLADIGGNTSSRTTFGILRIAEPAVSKKDGTAPAPTATVTAEKLSFSYPDGANHNAESLLVEPVTGALYVITKEASGPSTVYKLGGSFGGAASVAQKITQLSVPTSADGPATGASAHPCGGGFLLRTNNVIYEFRVPPGSPLSDAFKATPVSVAFSKETQGEAVAYRPDGFAFFNTGEGAMQPINQVGCQP